MNECFSEYNGVDNLDVQWVSLKITANLSSDCSRPFLTQKEMFRTAVFFLLLEKHRFFWPAYSLWRQLAIMTGFWNREQSDFPLKQQSLFISMLCLLEPLLALSWTNPYLRRGQSTLPVSDVTCWWMLTILLAKSRWMNKEYIYIYYSVIKRVKSGHLQQHGWT